MNAGGLAWSAPNCIGPVRSIRTGPMWLDSEELAELC